MDKKERLDKEEVKAVIEHEGLGYAVYRYLSHDMIKNRQLRLAWKNAEKALNKIQELLDV